MHRIQALFTEIKAENILSIRKNFSIHLGEAYRTLANHAKKSSRDILVKIPDVPPESRILKALRENKTRHIKVKPRIDF